MKSAILFCATAVLAALQVAVAQSTTSHSFPRWAFNTFHHDESSTTVTEYITLESPVCGMPCLGCVEVTMTIPNPGVVTVPVSCLFGTTTITQSWPPPGLTSSTQAQPTSLLNKLAAPTNQRIDNNKLLAVETPSPFAWSESIDASHVVTTTIHGATTECTVAKVSDCTMTIPAHAESGSLAPNATTTTVATATAGAGSVGLWMSTTAFMVVFSIVILILI